jgi:hypothetical protein
MRKHRKDNSLSPVFVYTFQHCLFFGLVLRSDRSGMPASSANPDPGIFVSDLQNSNLNKNFLSVFLVIALCNYMYFIFKDKKT